MFGSMNDSRHYCMLSSDITSCENPCLLRYPISLVPQSRNSVRWETLEEECWECCMKALRNSLLAGGMSRVSSSWRRCRFCSNVEIRNSMSALLWGLSAIYDYRVQMKASKYSNLGTSKYSAAVFAEDTCQEHEGMPFTNFCSSISCVRPLCPECVESHSGVHRNLRTQPEMASLKTLKNQCVNKIANILDRVELSQNEGSMNEINIIFENSLVRIRELRDLSRRIVDSYFTGLEDLVRKKMSSLMSQQSDLFQQLDRSNNIINELKLLVHRLDNSREFLSSAQTIIRLDGDKIEDKVRQSYSTIRSLKDTYKVNLHVEKSYEQKLVSYLSRAVYYGNPDTSGMGGRIVEEVMANNNMMSLTRKNSQGPANEYEMRGTSRESRSRDREVEREEDRKSTISRKSSRSGSKGIKKNIIGMNTFKESSPHKYLHFFLKDENILQYLDLEQGDTSFSSISIDITFKVPEFHKSIAIPNGDLYLLGGSIATNGLKSQKIYKYDFEHNTLAYCTSMKYGRSSHSVCFNSKYIYILGGFLNNQVITNRCQRYDILNNKIEEIKPMNYEACSFACCSFNGRYIYKFGGVMEDNSIGHQIEVYDEKEGEWSLVNPVFDSPSQKLLALSFSAAVQITQNEMMVMGGYDESNSGQKQTFVLRIDPTGAYIKDVNSYPLPFAQGFWNNTPIIQNKLVFALQNVSQGQDECLDDERKILVFDGLGWKCLN